MSDVGDAIWVILETVTGATVVASVYRPDGTPEVVDQATVESPPGEYRHQFIPDVPGVWRVVLTASGAVTLVEERYVLVRPLGGRPPLALVEDYVARVGPVTDEAQIGTLLADASRRIRSAVPTVDARIADGTLDRETAAEVAVAMVQRVMRNPGGVRTLTTGPMSVGFDAAGAAGRLYLDADDLALLQPTLVPSEGIPGVGTVRTTAGLAPTRRPGSHDWWAGSADYDCWWE